MPIIEIWGIPDDVSEQELDELIKQTQLAVADVYKLCVKPSQTTVRILRDLVQKGIGEELQARALSIFDKPPGKPERTSEVCQELNLKIRAVLLKFAHEHLPECTCIEVLPVDLVSVERGDYTICYTDNYHN
ncbi:hypothetical protein KJ910_01750 [Patescibacteria group bacterium]|nr:hypothetical protein [Patescibacteria group bacterium]MBU1907421.1 hypothetical protein [Patescibacteria group bacterium]